MRHSMGYASLIAAPFVLGLAGQAAAAPSTSLTVTGDILNPATYTAASLGQLPQVTESVTYLAAGSPVSATFTGPTLDSVVAASQIDANLAQRNAIVPYYLTATGSDGYRVVYALAELDPNFAGGGPTPPLVATAVNGGPLGSNGFARTTAPRDIAGGRYDSNLVNLDIEHAAPVGPLITSGGVSTSFALSGQVVHPTTYTLASLQALPEVSETTTYQGMHGSVTASYQGVSLWGLLMSAGIVTNPSIKNDILGKYAVVIGTDGYESVVSLGEIDPAFGNQPDIIAYGENGGDLGSAGFAQLVVPGDNFGGRYDFNIESIQVLDAAPVPEPSSAFLLTAALVGLVTAGAAQRGSANPRNTVPAKGVA